MTKRKRKSISIDPDNIVPIVGDAWIAGQVAEGRGVPVLIVDTSDHPGLDEVIRVHQHLPSGDVRVQWGGQKGDSDGVFLVLDFDRPIATTAILLFSIERQENNHFSSI